MPKSTRVVLSLLLMACLVLMAESCKLTLQGIGRKAVNMLTSFNTFSLQQESSTAFELGQLFTSIEFYREKKINNNHSLTLSC